jgi:hypothetical protein
LAGEIVALWAELAVPRSALGEPASVAKLAEMQIETKGESVFHSPTAAV